jgi:protein associated with RNAse G/E
MSYPSIFQVKMQVFFVFKKQFFNVIVMMKKNSIFKNIPIKNKFITFVIKKEN